MATYNKRGYKEPKPKEEKIENQFVPEQIVSTIDEKDSTTAGVFNALDETANKTEAWVEKNQKIIIGVLATITVITLGYFAYKKFIAEPKENDAIEQIFVAQQNFEKALEGTKSDSLYNIALKGSEGKYGFLKIADEYSGTKTGNLANYYAGISYLNISEYNKAIEFLEKFDSDDKVLKPMSIGAIGDAKAQLDKKAEALEYYIKAAEYDKNDMTTPMFLLKAGKLCLSMNKKADALKYFTDIKENYESTPEAQGIDGLIGMAQ